MNLAEGELAGQTTLGSLCSINPSKPLVRDVDDDTPVLFVPMAALDDETGAITAPVVRRLGEVRTKSYTTFTSGDVLFAKITPCMENGKSAIVPPIPSGLGFGSTEFHVLRPNPGIDARLIWHFVRQVGFRQEARDHMTGSVGQARVPKAFVEESRIQIPSGSSQSLLADLLDSTVERAQSGAMHLQTARTAVERFERAVRIAASDGRLTSSWRVSMGRTDESPGQPAGWVSTTIGEIAECLDSMRKPVNSIERGKRVGEVPYYGANGQVGWIDTPIFDEELVLVVEDETFTGRTKPFSYRISGPAWVNNHAHVLRPRGEMSADTLNTLLSYYNFVPLTSGTTGRRKLNKSALLTASLVVPPPEEQIQISLLLHQVDLLIADVLRRLQAAHRSIERSAESVLAKAFRGELTQKDPS
jgi:type I restriction enzyme S subunit